MKRIISVISLLTAATWLAAPIAAGAEEDIGNAEHGRVIYQLGKGDAVPACEGCHAPDGLGDDGIGSPRLAYQTSSYVLKQLVDFSKDLRTDDTMYQMNDIAKGLTEQDMKDVAAYVHTLKTPYIGSNLDQLRRDGAEVGDPHKGKMIAEYGALAQGVAACQSCHGFHGRSAGRMYPAIGGQNYVYLQHELTSFRNGYQKFGAATLSKDQMGEKEDNMRVNDYMGQMRAIAANLSDEDIANLAAFLTLAKPTTAGNPRAPSH